MTQQLVRETSRPTRPRTAREEAIYDRLDQLGIPFDRVDHEAAGTIAACRAVEETLGAPICKNLFLCNRQKTRFYLLAMPGDAPFRTTEVSRLIGSSRLSFAPPEDLERLLHVSPGSVSIMGLLHDTERQVTLLMDRRVARGPYLGCHPCVNTTSLRIRTQALLDKFIPFTGHETTILNLSENEEAGA